MKDEIIAGYGSLTSLQHLIYTFVSENDLFIW